MTLKDPDAVKVGEVIEINGLKSVVVDKALRSMTVVVTFRRVIGRGKQLRRDEGWTHLNRKVRVKSFGSWSGLLDAGATGTIVNRDGKPVSLEGESEMAVKSAAAKRAAAKKSGSKSKAGGERKRASNEELDEQAAEVVRLRDEEEMSWADVAESTGIDPGRLRQLYNRGGGEPTKQRKGSAKGKPKAAKGKASAKKGASARKKAAAAADPSDED